MRRFPTLFAALCAAFVLITTLSPQPTQAAVEVGRALNVVLLGDSYSAGNGAGSYEPGTEKSSYRSTVNWASHYVRWLNSQGIHTTFTNLAHSGNVTNDLLKDGGQIDQMPDSADLVMFTIGGNDVDFNSIVKSCFAPLFRHPTDCENNINQARDGLDRVITQTEAIFTKLEAKLKPNARVLLLSYPLLSTNDPYKLAACLEYQGDFCTKPKIYSPPQPVRELGEYAVQRQAQLVKNWNATHKLAVHYIDSMPRAFAGHEPNPKATARNPYRWINEFAETEGWQKPDGTTASHFSANFNHWYHPNTIGHHRMFVEIRDKFGIPESVHPIKVEGGDIDIVFAIDATGSMDDEIDAVKSRVSEIAHTIQSKSRSFRFGLVTYKDHPDEGGDSDDYPSRLEQGFTTDMEAFTQALNAIKVVGGGDNPETVYSGINEGLNLSWRPGVRKIMLVLGDAPPKDPEPVTGFTHAQIAKKAFDIDPVEIYTIDAGSLMSEPMTQLVKDSNGASFNIYDGTGVVDSITQALSTALGKPFAWLQGPIVGFVSEEVTFDARGSYAYDGPIATYEWDFDGDGTYDHSSSTGIVTHTFSEEVSNVAGVRVTGNDGQVSIGSAPVNVIFKPEPPVEQPVPEMQQSGDVVELDAGQSLPFKLAPGVADIDLDNPTTPPSPDVEQSSQSPTPTPPTPPAPHPPTQQSGHKETTPSKASSPSQGKGGKLAWTGAQHANSFAALAIGGIALGGLALLSRRRCTK